MSDNSRFSKLLKIVDDCLYHYYTILNDTTTRTGLKLILSESLEKFIQGDEFIIICDERINTPDVIDNHELRCLVHVYDQGVEYLIQRKLTSMGCSYYEE